MGKDRWAIIALRFVQDELMHQEKKPKKGLLGIGLILYNPGKSGAAPAHFENWHPGGKLLYSPDDTRRYQETFGDTWETPERHRCHDDTRCPTMTHKYFLLM